ncbi:hypothetical protein [Kordiimonas lacus]|uniref:DoxX-like family protein n=1 Tax=Kordiimonas lacus TaxID=637679 RepID=A0A1G6SVZ1_9PROT|nr:hypothetical protein [Kordiimonas lacus]SDD20881.1 hypothetical protein SAMN04488071_0006 [Kordiimonas lacus]
MSKYVLWAVGGAYLINGLVMWFLPLWWYETVPGIQQMGLYHMHFVRDIGIAYGVMGAGLFWASRSSEVGLFACVWPALHALYHVAIFFDRGALLDEVSATNLFLIQLPAWSSVWAAYRVHRLPQHQS